MPVNAGLKRGYGWKRQAFDPRDPHLLLPSYLLRRLTHTADISSGLGPQLDQGEEGSCGPNTADELITFDQKLEEIKELGASRLFIYWFTRYLMGTLNQDSGVDNRTMIQALNRYGFPPESVWPYDDTRGSMLRQPTQQVINEAAANKIADYAAVVQSPDQMKGVIASGKPFMFGFDVYQQIESEQAATNGVVNDPSPSESAIGGHDVTFCGYSDVTKPGVVSGNSWPAGTFKFRNHWMNGPDQPWGDGGYGYISYAYATNPNISGDFWVINTVPKSPVPPGPTPTPTPTPKPPTPTPVPPTPTPVPTPTPIPIDKIKQQIDALFARMEKQWGMFPRFVQALKILQAQVDTILNSYKNSLSSTDFWKGTGDEVDAKFHSQVGSHVDIPPIVISIVDAACDLAGKQYPEYSMELMLIKTLLDKYLPLI